MTAEKNDIREIVEQVLKTVKIEEIIGEYLPLKKTGRRFTAICPFHSDKDPSLSVSPDKGFFHCFGCGAGGNAINFVMKIEDVSFREALLKIAAKAGIKAEISIEKSEAQKQKDAISAIIRDSALFYYENLQSERSGDITSYLSKRGINLESARRFGLGYAPGGKNNLTYFLQKQGYGIDDIIASGMAAKYDDGNISDCFRNRITIPIVDHMGRFVAMAGRSLDNSHAKYINSQETPIFSKSKCLFGINLAKIFIQKEDKAVIVEGYFDMISLWQHGIKNVCASMGTSLTKRQAELLRKFTSRVELLYDSDEAGNTASDRNAEIFYNAGITPKVSKLPPGYDPDLYVREKGESALRKILEKSLDLIDFYIEKQKKICDLSTPSGKSEFVKSLLSHLTELKDIIILEEYIKRISEEAKVSENILRKMISGQATYNYAPAKLKEKKISPEERLLSILFRYPRFIPEAANSISLSEIKDENIRRIYDILFFLKPDRPIKAEDFSAYGEEEGLTNKIIELLIFESYGVNAEESAEALVEELIGKINDNILKVKFKELKKEVEEALAKNVLKRDDESFIEYRRLYQYFKGRRI